MNLIEHLHQLPDFRERSGQRHSQTLVLVLCLMSILSGHEGFRGMGDFTRRHRRELLHFLRPAKDRLPSYSTFRRVLSGLDHEALSDVFYQWAIAHVPLEKGEWLSVDGKALRGTVVNASTSLQDFIALVNVYNSKTKQVVAVSSYNNGKVSEEKVVQDLIGKLDLKDCVFTLDAIHCKKKR